MWLVAGFVPLTFLASGVFAGSGIMAIFFLVNVVVGALINFPISVMLANQVEKRFPEKSELGLAIVIGALLLLGLLPIYGLAGSYSNVYSFYLHWGA